MNDTERLNWLAVRAAATIGTDHVAAAAAARDSARLGDTFKLALASGKGPEDAMRMAVDQVAAMPAVMTRMRAMR